MPRQDLVLGLAVGVALTLALGRDRPAAYAEGPQAAAQRASSQLIAVTDKDLTGKNLLYIVDPQEKKLAVYRLDGKAFGHVLTRSIHDDLEFLQFDGGDAKDRVTQSPTVGQQHEEIQKLKQQAQPVKKKP